MKKVIIILVMIIYVASIAIVNIFGKPYVSSETNVYISELSVEYLSFIDPETGEEVRITEPTKMGRVEYYVIDFIPPEEGQEYTNEDENMAKNPNNIFIKLNYKTNVDIEGVEPDNPNIGISLNDSAKQRAWLIVGNEDVTKNELTIVFHKVGTATLEIFAKDGFNAKVSFRILVREKKS